MAGELHPLKDEQKAAARPDDLVWLSASAGTGKTQVLTARVFRLLMRPDVRPENILCLTFTKAGAAEMAARIQERLAAWVQMPEKLLRKELFAIGEENSEAAIARARTLFAEVIDAPGGGIRIQTIHSFCQTVLAGFPVEAGLIPGFRPLEEREQATLRREALADMLAEAEKDGRLAIVGYVQDLSLRLGEEKATQFLYRCGQYQEKLERITGAFAPALRQYFELPVGDAESWLLANVEDARVDVAGLQAIAAANAAWGTKTGLGHADTIAAWLAAGPQTRVDTLQDVVRTLVTAAESLQAIYSKQLADVGDLATRLAASLGTLLATPQHMALSDAIAGALEAGRDYARTYGSLKRARGLVDFDDLIERTVALLFEGRLSEWVRFKLDQRTDHILIDESQDTNTNQWAIANALTAELFEQDGAEEQPERVRTLFTVGDFKQAIFGFQGTSPIAYRAARDFFEAKAARANRQLQLYALADNFRSTPPILAMVDAVFETLGAGVMGIDETVVRHRSAKEGLPGRVTLWKPVTAGPDTVEGDSGEGDAGGEEDWIDEPTRTFANRLAAQIADWIAHGIDGRPVEPGDIMVLVRKRSDLAALIVARLYAMKVPVAGVDRLRLNAPLAVQDLLATIRFALQPHDDLNLASLLVSPLMGWTQEDLLRWGYRGKGVPLWRHLRALTGEPDGPDIAPLREILARADLSTPYRFLEAILSGPIQGRAKLLARLGNEARDPIEELLNAAIAFEQGNSPSLQLFLRWFDLGDVDIKRETGARANEVRVMTVHGSKGLQAPIVVLADATVNPDQSPTGGITLDIPVGDEVLGLPIFPVSAKAAFGPIADAITAQKEAERAEHWRLFYVAMTRAEEMLFVGGALGPRANGVPPEASWYAALDRTMDSWGAEWDADAHWGAARCYAPPAAKGWPVRAKESATGEGGSSPLPAWATTPAPQEARPPRPLAPSSLGEDDVSDPPPDAALAAARAMAAERGRLLHALFERLPAVTQAARAAAGARWLAAQAPHWEEPARAALLADALAILDDPAHAALFGPDSLAEAPIAAVLEDGLVVAGTVDRLIIRDDVIEVVDFKTGRRVPDDMDAIPLGYRRQMAAYVAALRVVFPGRPVHASLLYTAGPRWFAFDEAELDRDKPGFTAQQQS